MTHRPNARQIVEQMVLPASVTAIVLVMQKQLEGDDGVREAIESVLKLLKQSLCECTAGIHHDQIDKLTRRAKRVTNEVMSPIYDRYPTATLYMIIAVLISNLADDDIIIIGAESSFAIAWDIMGEILDIVLDDMPDIYQTATIEARNLRSRLAALGYFVQS